jgi:hypothetical protein
MASGGVSGLAVAEIAGGLVLAWSGIENIPIQTVVKSFISGKLPTAGPAVTYATPATATSASDSTAATINETAPGSGNASANKALGMLMAGGYGWVGSQYTDLVNLWDQESDWSATARNPSSGAYGIAQALGHGTSQTAAANGINEYGPTNGVSVATAKAANGGSAAAQIAWGLAYIKATYGSPAQAWAHEQANDWY